MARKQTLTWSKHQDGNFVDYESTDGHWSIGTGLDEYERKRGLPFLLTYRDEKGKGPWRRIEAFQNLTAAQQAATQTALDLS